MRGQNGEPKPPSPHRRPTAREEPRMRLPLIPPDRLNADQRPLAEDMPAGIEKNFKGFVSVAKDGTLLGPWNPWIHEPQFGGPVWALVKALASNPSLPVPVRDIAILVTGAHFRSAY